MAYVDFKITIWERVYFDDKDVDKVSDKLKSGLVSSSEDMFTEFDERVAHDSEVMYETAEQMPPEENDNQPTIELYNSNGEIVFNNGK